MAFENLFNPPLTETDPESLRIECARPFGLIKRLTSSPPPAACPADMALP